MEALRDLRGTVLLYTDPLEPVGMEEWGPLQTGEPPEHPKTTE